MKAIKVCSLAGSVLAVLWALGAHGQDTHPEVASEPGVAASSSQGKAANRALHKEVVRVLTRTKGLNTTRITVRVKDGAVMLQGSVPDQSEIDLAAQAAGNVSGVTSVKNSLTVIGPAGSQ